MLDVELELSAVMVPLVILIGVARPYLLLPRNRLLALRLLSLLSLDFLLHLVSR